MATNSDVFFMEDFQIGQTFRAGPYPVTTEKIISYANEFDPQYFHLDPNTATDSAFGAHVASGWHTASITMRLLLDAVPPLKGGMIGRSIEKMQWPKAVRAGDLLSIEVEILDMRPSKTKADRGMGRIRCITRNQRDEIVQEMETVLFLPRRTTEN